MDIEGTCKDMIRVKWSCSKTCWNLSSLCEEWVVVAATEAEKPLRWKRKHFLTDIFKLKNTNPHSCTHRWAQRHTHGHVFILISKAKEAASIFISCWSLSQREGERDEIRYQFVWFFLPHCCLQSFKLSVVICISFFQNPLRGFHANHSFSIPLWEILLTPGKHKPADSRRGTFLWILCLVWGTISKVKIR